MESAGERIKKLRLEKGISLEEVQKKTKIHLNILKALEGDSLTDLSPVYLKGFLKIYCNFLGVEPKDYIPDYKETQTVVKNADTSGYLLDRPEKAPSFLKTTSLKLSSFKPTKEFKTVSIFIVIIIFIAIGLFNLGKFVSSRRVHLAQGRPSPVAEKKDNAKAQKVQKSKAITGVTPKPQPKKITSQRESPSVIRLIIRARENCWVFLKADGRVVFQRVLEKGRFESWQAKDKIELSLGNAGAVELEVNGQLFSNLGRKGESRKNIVITKEGLDIGK
jgi:cytoskeletal protein RodZ